MRLPDGERPKAVSVYVAQAVQISELRHLGLGFRAGDLTDPWG